MLNANQAKDYVNATTQINVRDMSRGMVKLINSCNRFLKNPLFTKASLMDLDVRSASLKSKIYEARCAGRIYNARKQQDILTLFSN